MAEGVDYSGARPSGLCLTLKGKRFAGRYVGPGGSWKHATAAEVMALTASGLWIVSLVEGEVYGPLEGRALGRVHARLGDQAARAIGAPPGRPLYLAVDFDMVASQRGRVAEYLRGAADQIGLDRVGVYGGIRTVAWARDNNLATWSFQTYAWSGGRWDSRNHIEQYQNGVSVCGGDVDLCRSRAVDYGQWRVGQYPTPSDVPPPSSSTVDTSWDMSDHITRLADTFGATATSVDGAATQIEQLH